jgi:hypothetical protein
LLSDEGLVVVLERGLPAGLQEGPLVDNRDVARRRRLDGLV